MQALSITCDPLDTSGLLHHMLQNVSKETVRACSKENLEFLARIFKLQFSSDDDDEDVEALVDSFFERGYCRDASSTLEDGSTSTTSTLTYTQELEKVIEAQQDILETEDIIASVSGCDLPCKRSR
ncbi:hypothetical protein FDP41_013080 [Naegleria fowleri]|uniref:Uncharacterized protein n=1 Tax=Naegleria fowleri TaxID=5763 RepID=A0A6A5BTS2_NAEFO|nr:uncharacterized protein FDP41_013080 [Naegleria fowleri]KAF0980597.1 hypothetical protein FDP41_013080 [Naegleria fowleri]